MFNFEYMKALFKTIGIVILLVGTLSHAMGQITPNYNLGKLVKDGTLQHPYLNSSQSILNDENSSIGCSTRNENLVLNNGLLYLNPTGTGIIYTIDSNNEWKRIDATCFQGYNFGASFFMYNDTLYSVGGYGFWNYSGAIRYFDKVVKEWNIIKTDTDVPFANGINAITYFDNEQGLLYILYSDSNPEYYLNKSNTEKVKLQCYNIKSKKWWDKYLIIDQSIVKNISQIKSLNATNDGLIVNLDGLNHSLEIVFKEKKAYEVNDDFITHLIQEKSKLENYISFCKKDTLLFYQLKKDSITKIYYKNNRNKEITLFKEEFKYPSLSLVITILLLIIAILIIYVIKVSIINKKINIATVEDKKELDFKSFFDSLDYLEKDALKIILANSISNNKTTVEEINKVLGTSKRNYKIQNNIRAEIIGLVNKKFISALGTKDILIERNRTTFDKRFFEYEISPKYLKKLSVALK